MADPRVIVRGRGIDWSNVWRGRHPFNPKSEMCIAPLSDLAGMKRIGVKLIRIPPGKESFIFHAHLTDEEFVYVLEGVGEAILGEEVHPIGPGDFVGFPIDGVAHSIRSVGPGDLLYLTGGERVALEVAEMPSIGKTAVFGAGRMRLFGEDGVTELTEAEWMARTKIED